MLELPLFSRDWSVTTGSLLKVCQIEDKLEAAILRAGAGLCVAFLCFDLSL